MYAPLRKPRQTTSPPEGEVAYAQHMAFFRDSLKQIDEAVAAGREPGIRYSSLSREERFALLTRRG